MHEHQVQVSRTEMCVKEKMHRYMLDMLGPAASKTVVRMSHYCPRLNITITGSS